MRHYFLFFFVFCILICGGLYVFNSSEVTLSFFQKTFSFPLAVWVFLSTLLFFIGSLFFFANTWLKKFLFDYRFKKDLNTLTRQIHNQSLHQESHLSYKTKGFGMLSKILQRMKITPNLDTPPSQDPKIDKLFMHLQDLQDGKILKDSFKPDTPFWEQNLKNKITTDLKFAQKVLEGDYSQELKYHALDTLLSQENLQEKTIQTLLKTTPDAKSASSILETLLQKGYRLSREDDLALLKKIDEDEIFGFMQHFKAQFDPDFCLDLFKELALHRPKAQEAYAYLLLDYAMFERAKEFILEHDNLVLPKAYLELKEQGKNYPLEAFF